jgi:putative Holliday junction resolvase
MLKKSLDVDFFLKNLAEIKIDEMIASKSVLIGLDVGDKTVGIAVSDVRIKIASVVTTISRKGTDADFRSILECVKDYRIGLVIFGWPLQMNGVPGEQCEKVLKFVQQLSKFCNTHFAKWDERYSTKVVNNLMIQADLSRKKRKKLVDQSAAVYILQGAIDFLNLKSDSAPIRV